MWHYLLRAFWKWLHLWPDLPHSLKLVRRVGSGWYCDLNEKTPYRLLDLTFSCQLGALFGEVLELLRPAGEHPSLRAGCESLQPPSPSSSLSASWVQMKCDLSTSCSCRHAISTTEMPLGSGTMGQKSTFFLKLLLVIFYHSNRKEQMGWVWEQRRYTQSFPICYFMTIIFRTCNLSVTGSCEGWHSVFD